MATAKQAIGKTAAGWPAEKLVSIYRLMYLSRRLDDKEITLKKQNKIFFQISGAGHEAVLVAAGMALRPGYDWFYPYYRDRGLVLALGMTPTEVLMEATGSAADPNSGGRQMPCHWGHKKLNIVNQSSPTGTQFLQAVGCAKATRYYAEVLGAEDRPANFHPDEITYVSGGDGATSEGEFWEAVNFASLYRLPVLFLIEDNDYAISVPKEFQTAGGSISKLLANFPSLFIKEVDGCDPLKSYEVIKEAERYMREGRGPALVHAHVIRPYSHSLSDVQADYRSPKEIQEENARDPILTFANFLVKEKVLTEAELARLKEEVDAEIDQAADEALASPQPAPESAELFVYSPDIDPTSKEFESEPKFKEGTQPLTLVAAINTCLKEEMARNKKVLIYGEDVADCSRVESLSQVTGKGGVFKVTIGLQKAFGPERAFNSPLAEATIVGTAVGMATRGLKPVVEIQFFDYIWPAMMQIVNEWSKMRWRSNNANSSPAIIRVPFGGYLHGGSVYHSQSGESIFAHIPGIRILFPSNALDANGLLRTAIRTDDPVLFLEHKHLYRQPYNRTPDPGPDFTIPFGKARITKPGKNVTLITYGALVYRSEQAAAEALERGIEVEVIDLRTIMPYDWETIAVSVKKTGKVVVAHEDVLTCGFGAEIAARVAQELFDYLDAPVTRVGALDTPVGYAPTLEEAILPSPKKVLKAILDVAEY